MKWTTGLQQFREGLTRAGLSVSDDDLGRLLRPSVRFDEAPDRPSEGFGESRLGGRPDLPEGAVWPESDWGPLSFLMQIDLREASALLPAWGLPSSGLLSFFYDAEGLPGGGDESDRGGWRVLYTPSDAGIARRLPPDDLHVDAEFEARRIVPTIEWTVAPDESTEARDILGTPSAIEAYEELIGAPDDRLNTRLLGHPDPVQGDMQDTCQLAGHGLWDGSSDPRVAELRGGSGEWRLLAQIDSHEDLGMMWGDCGRLYFWIRDADLRTRNWDAAWVIMQCH